MLMNKNDANKNNASTKSADPTQESQDYHQGNPSQESYSQEDCPTEAVVQETWMWSRRRAIL
jgi:hypothetical protein